MAGHGLGTLEGGRGGYPFQCIPESRGGGGLPNEEMTMTRCGPPALTMFDP